MDSTPTEALHIDQHQSSEILSRIRLQQNLQIAVLAGSAAAVISAVIWATVTVSTEYQIGWMAVGVGYAVGFGVRLGKGIDKVFGILGAAFALLGCILGNFFALIGFLSKEEEVSLLETVSAIDYSVIPELMISTSSPMDLLFYAIAIYEGYRLSFRKISQEDISAVQSI